MLLKKPPGLILARPHWLKVLPYVGLTEQDVQDAHARLSRFAPYLAKAFPETAATGGIIESELVAIPAMQKRLEKEYQQPISRQLLLKKIAICPFPAP
ncbi:D-serine ammonia-lyase [Escherichia coli]|nr:D-serine ammonia-lyase [Escherichia coli]